VVAHRQLTAAQAQLDQAARRAPIARVVDQVRHRACDPLLLPAQERRLEVQVELHLRPRAPARPLD
jgi:multidrug efflux pump subunit AcrA (membrane-fusion protein)